MPYKMTYHNEMVLKELMEKKMLSKNMDVAYKMIGFLSRAKRRGINLELTGSRFFGNARVDSDFDYFVQDSPQVRKFLFDDSFMELGVPYDISGIHDLNLATVFRRGSGSEGGRGRRR